MEAILSRLEPVALRVEAIASRFEAFCCFGGFLEPTSARAPED